jgi:serine/threonine protein kinase
VPGDGVGVRGAASAIARSFGDRLAQTTVRFAHIPRRLPSFHRMIQPLHPDLVPLKSGFRLGPYEVIAPLGAGGMGEVYRAKDTRLDRTVAIKVLPAHVASDPSFRDRFEREAKVISSLDHPNICALYDVGRENGVDFLVMPYLEGETLDQFGAP